MFGFRRLFCPIDVSLSPCYVLMFVLEFRKKTSARIRVRKECRGGFLRFLGCWFMKPPRERFSSVECQYHVGGSATTIWVPYFWWPPFSSCGNIFRVCRSAGERGCALAWFGEYNIGERNFCCTVALLIVLMCIQEAGLSYSHARGLRSASLPPIWAAVPVCLDASRMRPLAMSGDAPSSLPICQGGGAAAHALALLRN